MRWIALPVVILLVALAWIDKDRRGSEAEPGSTGSSTSPASASREPAGPDEARGTLSPASTPSRTEGAQMAHADKQEHDPQDRAREGLMHWDGTSKVQRSEAEWRKMMSDLEYRVMREKGTERAFTGEYWDHKEPGTYHCRACNLALFRSDAKFDSGCGWPSFFEPLEGAHLEEHRDTSHGMIRTEITCKRCGAHLGHVFKDGPPPTGLRYCINSVSIKHAPKGEAEASNSTAPVEDK